jgi:DNA-binding SARP family transcriptional activator/tetratricopeptide (TPR) repeat protein
LLIWLALEPSRPHRRDRLADLLWPKSAREEARHSLATALSFLRSKIGPEAFEARRDTIRLLPGQVSTDIAIMESDGLSEAEMMSIGPFLEDLEIPGCPDFQHWIDGERARIRPLLRRQLARRIDGHRQTGDVGRMGALASQLERIDPLSEEAARALVESRAMAGDRLGALRGYDQWQHRLAEELGASPSSDLERIVQRLRRGRINGPGGAALAPVPTEQWKERVFVGRTDEFQSGYRVWQRVLGGEPSHLLIRGESGIGKSTLADRLATSTALEGASVARIQCYELERELPFGMVGSLVTQLLDLPGASATPPAQLAELGRIVPTVSQRWPGLPVPSSPTGEFARIQLTESVMALIEAIADEHPLVLLIDDLHLADVTSLAVLHLILRRVDKAPLMSILTVPGDDDSIPDGARRFADNPESVNSTVVRLGPLPDESTALLLDSILAPAADVRPTVRRSLLAGARGNPMLLELLLGDWDRHGDQSIGIALHAMTSRAESPPWHTFHRLIDSMLSSLDNECRSVANLAAILGQRLNDMSMYSLVDLPIARTMRALSTLTSQGVLRDGGNHLAFSNEVVRAQCYVAMPEPLRRTLHSMVADRLLAEGRSGDPVPGLETAWHLVRGDRLPEAVPYLLAGGRESIRRGAPHEADLALSTGIPALDGAARREAVLLLAEALQELGRWAESLRVLTVGGLEFSDEEEEVRTLLTIHAHARLGQLTLDRMEAASERLTMIATHGRSPQVRVRAAAVAIPLLNYLKSPDHVRALDRAVDGLTESQLDEYHFMHLRFVLAWIQTFQHDYPLAMAHLEEASQVARTAGYGGSIVVRILVGLANTKSLVGSYHEALQSSLGAYDLSLRLDNETLQRRAATQAAVAYGRLSDSEQQIAWATRGLNHGDQERWATSNISLSYELGLGLALNGDTPAAMSVVDSMSRDLPENPPHWALQGAALCGADITAVTGNARRAQELARSGISAPLLDTSYSGQFARWTALLAIEDGSAPEALKSLEGVFHDRAQLHAKDQVEISVAFALLREATLGSADEDWQDVRKQLGVLPVGVGRLLHAIGLLPASIYEEIVLRRGG